jgi:branched-subunit amino acid aminotransferase/4-amino-4-deoxychorismate lyase
MSRNGWFVVGFLMGTCSIAAGTASAQRSDAGTTMDVCPNDYLAFAEDSAPLTCGCSVDAVKNGSLYGPNPYAAISAICRAALHAGAVGAKGGQVVITPAPKTPMFPGVTRNGISSHDDSRAGLGFRIAAAGGGAAAAPSNAAIVVAASGTTMEVCPNDYLAFAEDSAPLTCGCSVDAVKNGSLYGANPYTAISAICRAALQAGAVGAKGGQVVITPVPMTPMFPGVTRNGVVSNDDSRAGLGFRIVAAEGGAAAAPSNAAIVVAASGTTMDVCPNDYLAFAEDSAPLTCGCSVDAVKNGSLYGANPYTAISAICRAALQAGAVGAKGGQAVITPAPKTPMFPGVTRNGISSNDDRRTGLGFHVAAAGGGAEAAPSNAAIVVAASGTTMDVCPNDYLAFADDSAPLTCGCSVDAVKNGSLYGANPYTAISAICRAALQAGALGAKGGQVVITPAPRTPMFPGVTRNGISSNYDRRTGLGFRVAAAGGGAAAAGAINANQTNAAESTDREKPSGGASDGLVDSMEGTGVATAPIANTSLFGRRIALVIGNSSYKNVPALANPRNDATSVAEALRRTGFAVVDLQLDLERDRLVSALRNFAQQAEAADWAVVYYAGHGMEVGGINYVIPVDAKIAQDRDIGFEAVPLGQVLNATERAKKLHLVILDACRDNPFANQMKRTLAVASRSVSRGLAAVEPDAGTLVVFSAKDGETSFDGDGANSPFAKAFLKNLKTPGLEVRRLFDFVRDDVLDATQHRQNPFSYGSVSGRQDFYFVSSH